MNLLDGPRYGMVPYRKDLFFLGLYRGNRFPLALRFVSIFFLARLLLKHLHPFRRSGYILTPATRAGTDQGNMAIAHLDKVILSPHQNTLHAHPLLVKHGGPGVPS